MIAIVVALASTFATSLMVLSLLVSPLTSIRGHAPSPNPPRRLSSDVVRVSAAQQQSIAHLVRARADLRAMSVGNTAIFAGGYASNISATGTEPLDTMDLFDRISNQWSIGRLPRLGADSTAVVGSKIIFAGGHDDNTASGFSDAVDIYDVTNNQWSSARLSRPRYEIATTVVGPIVIFAGGREGYGAQDYSDVIDLYDSSTGRWSAARLSQARIGIGVTSVGTKAFFAGGMYHINDGSGERGSGRDAVSDVVDMYDVATERWSNVRFSRPRTRTVAASVGTTAVFAGGDYQDDPSNPYSLAPVDNVDLYDLATGIWSTASLSQPRSGLAMTTVGSSVFFAGGYESYISSELRYMVSDVVDMFDSASGRWSVSRLSQSRKGIAATSVGQFALFAGGNAGVGVGRHSYNEHHYDTVDIYDRISGAWSVEHLSVARSGIGATSVGTTALFAGGRGELGMLDTVDVYTFPVDAR